MLELLNSNCCGMPTKKAEAASNLYDKIYGATLHQKKVLRKKTTALLSEEEIERRAVVSDSEVEAVKSALEKALK